MMKPELAREQLTKLRSQRHMQARHARMAKLPKNQAAIAFGLIGRRADGTEPDNWQERQRLYAASSAALASDAKLRAKVVKACFPTLAAELEAAWHHLASLPYTTGSGRRAFR